MAKITEEERAKLRPLFDEACNTPVVAPFGLAGPDLAALAWERFYDCLDEIAVQGHSLPKLPDGLHYGVAEDGEIIAPCAEEVE